MQLRYNERCAATPCNEQHLSLTLHETASDHDRA